MRTIQSARWCAESRRLAGANRRSRTSRSVLRTDTPKSFLVSPLGRQTSDGQGWGTISRSYDLAGRVTRRTWQDGFYVDYDRLLTGEISAIRENGATSGVGVLATYGYDNLGNRTSLMFGNGVVQAYAYDPLSRLTTLTNDLSGTANDLTVGGSSTPISYNPASQIASAARTGDAYAWTGHYNVNRGYTANGLNQYSAAGTASFAYDARGNLISDGTNSYTYTSENLLKTASGGISLYYDPLGRLSEYDTSSSTRFMSDGPSLAVEVDNPGGNILRRYVRGDGMDELLVWYEGSGTANRRFLSTDERRSIVSATDSNGNLVGINTYDEYGIPGSSNIGRFQYTGQAWLPELGMQYSKARIYSPTLGRFMQTDPIGYEDGPNWYAYTHSDPVNGVDPLGLNCDTGIPANAILICGHRNVGGGGSQSAPSGPSANQNSLETRFDNKTNKKSCSKLDKQLASIANQLERDSRTLTHLATIGAIGTAVLGIGELPSGGSDTPFTIYAGSFTAFAGALSSVTGGMAAAIRSYVNGNPSAGAAFGDDFLRSQTILNAAQATPGLKSYADVISALFDEAQDALHKKEQNRCE